ncbi:hypothetical protein ASPBRDRAFT_56050 [Aspergillus brasiliensis CBS 101740]|uniref:Uncharacterized protein n=1 Tax=Aspergillus brasiliensis (strain CBS 101740 / IMI 381727 / IBT 21946) TaxID=767769 RepID=A0A1L9UIP3_ASPBC|nr:hypothetical protein ASPBRDRAFT_56050 [Aspergillus brasiliensis CBS 101740]
MSSHQSSQPRAIQTPSLAQDPRENDGGRERRSISEESDLSHYLHYEDNECFFPPTWLGKKPPTQQEFAGTEPRITSTIEISRGDHRGACWNKVYWVLSF